MKKLIALVLALVMMFALCACTGGEAGQGGEASLDPLTKDDVIKISIRSHPSWPYNENWKVWEYIREGVGATLEVTAIPESDIGTKLPLMFTGADTMPDVLQVYGRMNTYARDGALVAIDTLKDYMPNAWKFYDSLSEEEYDNIVTLNREADGNLYWISNYGREGSQNVMSWLYRKDIFEKHNLKVPTTFDELYEVCKELKKLYPDSYPFCMRSGSSMTQLISPSFNKYWNRGVYYDYDDDVWGFGLRDESFREQVEFLSKMREEGLLMENFWNIPTSSWQELITTDRGFIMPDYQTRIDFFNSLARPNNPDFDLEAMPAPIANPEKGGSFVNKQNVEVYGYVLPNSRDERRITNAAKYLDWFFTDEATELVSWGKEGETYEIVDGKKQFITDEAGTQPLSLYGFNSNGSAIRILGESIYASESADIAETRDMVLEHTLDKVNPADRVTFTQEEATKLDDINAAIGSYANEMMLKLILGQEPLSKWDEFVAELNTFPIDEMVEIYKTAYERVMNK